jgi:hypothetical protein
METVGKTLGEETDTVDLEVRRHMRNVLALVFILALSGCASQHLGRDPLCQEISTFANATKLGETHVVSLETAWGASKSHPASLNSRDCAHGGYEPGARLCRYLMEHSAAEFPHNNFRAAFACLSGIPAQTRNYVSYERLDARVSAYGAVGVRDDVELSLEFKPNPVNGTMQLDIGATALGSVK